MYNINRAVGQFNMKFSLFRLDLDIILLTSWRTMSSRAGSVKRLDELPTGYPEIREDLSSGFMIATGTYFRVPEGCFLLKLRFSRVLRMLCGGVSTAVGPAGARSYLFRKLPFESSSLYW